MSAGFTLPLTTKQFQDHPAAHHDPADDQRAEAPLVHPDIGPCAEACNAFSDPCEQTILTEGLSQHVGFTSLRDRHEARTDGGFRAGRRATKKSRCVGKVSVYKEADLGGQNGNPGL